MKKILTLLLSFPAFGMEGNRKEIQPNASMLMQNFDSCMQEGKDIPKRELEELVLRASHREILRKILKHCQEKDIILQTEILEKSLLQSKDSFMREAIFNYCSFSNILLSEETLHQSTLGASTFTMLEKNFKYTPLT
jgi:hypothetical protein